MHKMYISPQIYMCWGLNSQCFPMVGDGHQPNSRGFIYPLRGFPTKGGMTIPNIRSLDLYVTFIDLKKAGPWL